MDRLLAVLLVVLLFIAFILIGGLVFMLVWNDFVFQHLHTVTKASFGSSGLMALAIGSLTGAVSRIRS